MHYLWHDRITLQKSIIGANEPNSIIAIFLRYYQNIQRNFKRGVVTSSSDHQNECYYTQFQDFGKQVQDDAQWQLSARTDPFFF